MRTSKQSRRPLTVTLAALLSCGACAVTPDTAPPRSASLTVDLPAYVREPCEGASLSLAPVPEAFAVSQTGYLNACDGKRGLAVTTVDIHNKFALALEDARVRIDCLSSRGWRIWRKC